MSSPSATISLHASATTEGGLLSRAARLYRSSAFWMLADQGVVSLGNFASINLLARHLAPAQFGGLSMAIETMLFLNSLQAGLIIYPLTLSVAGPAHARSRQFASAALLFTLLLLPILGLAMTLTSLACGLAVAAVAAVSSMLLGQIQETLRRTLIAERRIAPCVAGDAISYLGQAIILYCLGRSGHLTVVNAFFAIGFTSAVAAAIQSIQIGLTRITGDELWTLARQWWGLGRWMLLSAATLLITSLGFMWTLRAFHGLEAVGSLLAIALLLKLANPIVSSVASLIVPGVSRACASGGGPGAATRSALRYALLGACLLGPYFLLLMCAPRTCLSLVYGANSRYVACAPLLRACVMNSALAFIAAAMGAWLCGLGKSRANFTVQVAQSVAVLCIGLPLTIYAGLSGLLIGAGIGYLVQVSTSLLLIRPTLRSATGSALQASPPQSFSQAA